MMMRPTTYSRQHMCSLIFNHNGFYACERVRNIDQMGDDRQLCVRKGYFSHRFEMEKGWNKVIARDSWWWYVRDGSIYTGSYLIVLKVFLFSGSHFYGDFNGKWFQGFHKFTINVWSRGLGVVLYSTTLYFPTRLVRVKRISGVWW